MDRPEPVTRPTDVLGETPLWLAQRRAVAWIDAVRRVVRLYDTVTGRARSIAVPVAGPLGAIAPGPNDDTLVLAAPGVVGLVDLVSRRFIPLLSLDATRDDIVCNDAKVDRHGALWVGTCERPEREPRGALYRIGRGDPVLIDAGFVVPNGPAFSVDGRIAYVSDTMAGRILAYPLDAAGTPTGPRAVFADLTGAGGLPDGLTIDRAGCLWCGLWNGGGIIRFDPSGAVLARIALPATNVTSLAFGGPDLTDLYITSARTGLSRQALAAAPLTGALFHLRAPVAGMAEPPWCRLTSVSSSDASGI